ncbi:MAG: GAF domain-containing protein [Deltaproteobacteria bacterium]|nr:GAF domain-containing protein [Deltaproteobacteria bacterium]
MSKDKDLEQDIEKGLLSGGRGEEILNILKKGTEFTNEILKENEKLRYRVAQLEEANTTIGMASGDANLSSQLDKLQKQLAALSEEKVKLQDRYKEVEAENQDFAQRYIEIENENNIMANLYVASYQLHSTLDFNEVLRIILEIIINLVGAEKFALMLLDEKTSRLTVVATEGMEKEEVAPVPAGEGIIGKTAETGENYFAENLAFGAKYDVTKPIVCIPMKIKERVIGTIVIYSLLAQKDKFTKLDYELFTLLAGHTATAIFSSKLYSESERKLSTIQGFIDLMTK